MVPIPQAFSASYAQARVKFLEAAASAGTQIESHRHPLPGRDGEVLALDVALDGDAQSERLLIVSSACHGVEGFCGSGVQVFALHDADWRQQARDAGVAVLYLHALNPYGFSHLRRVTHEGVDLNRNFHDFSRPLPRNTGYDEIAHLLVPANWPPDAENQAAIMRFIGERGMGVWQTAITAGQHNHPEGLFYGGHNPTWSQVTVRQVLRDHARRCQRLGWIDLHTGLGPSGLGERIFACRDDAAALARVRGWWGQQVTSIYDGSSTSALLTGMMWMAVYEECPQAEYTGIALEYGTVPITEVLDALRGDQWLENHPEVGEPQRSQIKRRIRDAFYTDTDAWKLRIVEQGHEAALQGVAGLAGRVMGG